MRPELRAGFLACNLIRHSMLQNACVNDGQPEHLSFTANMQFLAKTWLAAALAALECSNSRDHLVTLRLTHGHSHRVGNRPNRIEPRAIKRRPSTHDLLTIPRAEARASCIARRSS
ncbi:MAG: hypothetical protein ACKO3P_08810 [Planctomycetaceae bacterium]